MTTMMTNGRQKEARFEAKREGFEANLGKFDEIKRHFPPSTRTVEGGAGALHVQCGAQNVSAEAVEDVAAPERVGAKNAGAGGAVTAGKRRGWKRIVGAVVFAALAVTGGVYGWNYWQWASAHETTDDAFIDGQISQISPRVAGGA